MRPGTVERAVSRYLIGAIMKAQTWQELEHLATEHTTHLNHIHVSALVCRLAKVVTPADLDRSEKAAFNRFLGTVSDLVSIRLDTFDARGVANVLWAVSKLGYSPAPPLLNKFLFAAYTRMHEFKAQELANLAWALATLAAMGNQPVKAWLRKFVAAAVPRVSELKPAELAHLSWAVSRLCPCANGGADADAGEEAGGGASPVDASGRPSVGAAPPTGRWAPSAERAGTKRPTAPDAPLDASVRSNAGGRGSRPDANAEASGADGIAGSTAAPLPEPFGPLPELISALTSKALTSLPGFTPGELCMTISSLHRTDPAAGWQLVQAGLPHLLRAGAGELSPQDHGNLWYVLGECASAGLADSLLLPPQAATPHSNKRRLKFGQPGGHDVDNPRLLLPKPSKQTAPLRLHGTAATGLAAPGAGLLPGGGAAAHPSGTVNEAGSEGGGSSGAVAASRPSGHPVGGLRRHHLYALLDATERSVHGLTVQGMCMVTVAWARLRLPPSGAVLRSLYVRFLQLLPRQSTFQYVAISLWALTQLRVNPPPPVVGLFMRCARLQVAAANPGELVAFLSALLRLRLRPSRSFQKRLDQRLRQVAAELTPHGLHIAIRAYTMFGVILPAAVRQSALSVTGTAATAAEVALARARARRWLAARGRDGAATYSARRAAARLTDLTAEVRQALASLESRHPATTVRFLATLAGVGMPKPKGRDRRAAANHSLRRLRAGLSTNESRAPLAAALEVATSGRLGLMTNNSLCAMLTTMARLQLRPRSGLRKQIFEQAEARLPAMEPWQAGGLVAAFAGLGLRPSADWLMRVLRLLGEHFAVLGDRQLLGVLRGLAKLRYRPPERWVRALMVELFSRDMDKWSASSLSVLLRGLGVLGLRLGGGPARRLQMLVYRKKRAAEEDNRYWGWALKPAEKVRGRRPVWGQRLPGGKELRRGARLDLKLKLCTVCPELSGCRV